VCVQNYFEPMVRLVHIVHLSCVEINTISKWTEMSFHFSHVTLEYHQVRLVQTVQLSCVEVNTISKKSEMCFHLNHVT